MTRQSFGIRGRLNSALALAAVAIYGLALAFPAPVPAQQVFKISGVVSDSMGSPIAKAVVRFDSSAGSIRTATDEDGKFIITSSISDGLLIVSCAGFMTSQLTLSAQSLNEPIRVRLDPAALIERIVVTASEDHIPATPTSQLALSRREIEVAGALTVDDLLRQVLGFSLFRRSGSLTANPTSQGVSLRGVGANGASRALVLLDGVPLNSPFGGWVYWNRVPRASIESIEIYNGATSDTYGSGALGGIVNIRSRATDSSHLSAELSFGNQSTPAFSFYGSKQLGRWGVSLAGQALRTDGYILVTRNQSGTVDTPAGTSDLTGSFTLSRRLSREGRAFLRLNSFGESRRNGTPLQVNDTRITSVDIGTDWSRPVVGDLSIRLFGSIENFNQNFSAIASDRNSESLTNRQRNPSQQLGFAFQWRRPLTSRQSMSAGFEGRDVRGHSAETTFNASRTTAYIDAGGNQRTFGFFAQDYLRAGSWVLTLGGRLDHWANSHGFSNRIPVSGPSTLATFPNRSETAFSPRLSVLRRLDKGFSIGFSFYKAFRASTLNELYRNFRVGNVVTNANASLRAERMIGGEAGIGLQTFAERLTIRGNFFWNTIDDPIANVTLSTTAALITRQRQNLGALRARGIEIDAMSKIEKHWQLSAGYLLTDSTVTRFPANLNLEGLRIPQIPKHQFNIQIDYSNTKWRFGVQGRFVGKQFEDDLNTLALKGFLTVDAEVSRSLSSKTTLFAALQNLTGTRYEIGRSPVLTVGPPLLIRVGGRFALH